MGDGDFMIPLELLGVVPPGCKCNLCKRPLPSKVRTGQRSSCCGGGEPTRNEVPAMQA